MRILMIAGLLISYIAQAQSDTLQLSLQEIDSTGKLIVKSSIPISLSGKLATNGSITNTTGINTTTQTALNDKSTFYVGISGGANDSYTITASPVPLAYVQGMIVVFRANTVNTGAASINVNNLGVKTIVKRVSTTLANGDIPALQWCMLVFDGTNFVILNPVVN